MRVPCYRRRIPNGRLGVSPISGGNAPALILSGGTRGGSMRTWLSFRTPIRGVRFGVALPIGELLRPKANTTNGGGSFVYVIRGDHNLVKVGVSTNPNARLAQLRTASAFPIEFSYIACTPGTGFEIEQLAHSILANHRCSGEWFDVQPDIAVAALASAAHKLRQPLQPVTQDQVEQVLRIAASGPASNTANRWLQLPIQIIGSAIFGVASFAVVMFIKSLHGAP